MVLHDWFLKGLIFDSKLQEVTVWGYSVQSKYTNLIWLQASMLCWWSFLIKMANLWDKPSSLKTTFFVNIRADWDDKLSKDIDLKTWRNALQTAVTALSALKETSCN